MEALTAVAGAALTLYDMVKAVDRDVVIGAIRLLEKAGGRTGRWRAGQGQGQGQKQEARSKNRKRSTTRMTTVVARR
jgi:hypothetical protein